MTIVDDEFAVVGSMNYNRRSWTHDSEVVAAIHDTLEGDGKAYHFAHRLRIASWAEHLNMKSPSGYAELADGVASAVNWLNPPKGARIATYGSVPLDDSWDVGWDAKRSGRHLSLSRRMTLREDPAAAQLLYGPAMTATVARRWRGFPKEY